MNENLNSINVIKYLILSLPVLLISGPLLPEIAILVICLITIFKFGIVPFKIFNKKLIYLFLIFYIILIIGSFLSDHKLYSLKSTLFYFRFMILAVSINYILNNSNDFLRKLKNVLLLIFIALILDGFYQYFFKENIIGLSNVNVNRVSSFFGKELIYGSYLSKFLPFLIGLLILFQKSKFDKIVIYLILFLSFFAIFISGERAAFFLSIISIILIFSLSNFFSKSKYYFFVISSLIFIFLISSNNYIKEKWTSTISKSIYNSFNKEILFEDKNYKLILNEKYTFMTYSALKMYRDRPFIGHGVKTFRLNCKKDKFKFDKFDIYNSRLNCNTHPHNTYIQLLAETGTLGFLIIFILLFVIILNLISIWLKRNLHTNNKIYDFKICLMTNIFLFLFPFTTTGSFFNNWNSIIYFFPIGFLIFMNKNYKD